MPRSTSSRQHHPWDDELPDTPDGVIECTNVDVYYGDFRAVTGVNLAFGYNEITALIGPSGCGKSTLLRSLNRMNDLILGARVTGQITYHGEDIYGRGVDAIEVRRRIGMVFQKPNPFPKSIYDNVAYGPRVDRHESRPAWTTWSRKRSPRPPCGTRSRTSSSSPPSASPVVNSSGSASPGPSPSSPR